MPPISQSVSGTLDRPRVVASSKTCGHVRSSRRRWRWAQCRPRSAAPTFGRFVLAGASTPAWCPVYRLRERPQPGVVGLYYNSHVVAVHESWYPRNVTRSCCRRATVDTPRWKWPAVVADPADGLRPTFNTAALALSSISRNISSALSIMPPTSSADMSRCMTTDVDRIMLGVALRHDHQRWEIIGCLGLAA